MDKDDTLIRKLRTIAALLLVGMYVAGLIAMLTSNIQTALVLWVISTLGGIALLYNLKKQREAERESAETNARDGVEREP